MKYYHFRLHALLLISKLHVQHVYDALYKLLLFLLAVACNKSLVDYFPATVSGC